MDERCDKRSLKTELLEAMARRHEKRREQTPKAPATPREPVETTAQRVVDSQ